MSQPRFLDPEVIIPISRGSTEAFKTGSWSRRRPEFVEKPSPCRAACPNGNNIAAALYRASEGDFDGALGAYLEESALPGVCGRVCYRPCQTPCNRVDLDGALEIRALERVISEQGLYSPEALTDAGKDLPVAVVGSGPAGLAAAYHLARMGHPVTLLEARDRLGGLLAGGLPPYRLPEDVLERDLARILSLNIQAVTGQPVDAERLAELRRSHRAVVLAVGTWAPVALDIPGEELEGVVPGLEYLLDETQQGRVSGRRVAVIGGGNTAMDAARVALRRGAASVTVLYRRTREAMPAFAEEVREAEEEGVEFHFLVSPSAVRSEGGRVVGVRCQAMRLTDANDGSRPAVAAVPDQFRDFSCDLLLSAAGQTLGGSPLLTGLARGQGRLVDDGWGRTNEPGVYVAGDAGPGRATVVDAMASAKRAAIAVHRDLTGQGTEPVPRALGDGAAFSIHDLFSAQPTMEPGAVAEVDEFSYLTAVQTPPHSAPQLEPAVRVKNFSEVSGSFAADVAKQEAGRCFFCGTCIGCDYCATFCPEVSFGREPGQTAYQSNPEFCKGCGACASVCVRGVLTMGDER